jgi:hypothetical protein
MYHLARCTIPNSCIVMIDFDVRMRYDDELDIFDPYDHELVSIGENGRCTFPSRWPY